MLLRHRLQNVFLLLPVQSVNFALIWLPSVTKTAKTASLRAMNPKLIDDCDLVNDKLLLSFPKMTTKPHCISQITMRFMNMDPPFEVTVPVNGSLEYLNPFRGPSRCVPMKILMIITFLSLSHYRNVELENIVTPLAEKCLTNFTICTTFTPDTKRLLILPK